MIKKLIIQSLSAGALATIVSTLYTNFYYGKLIKDFSIADFSESVNIQTILKYDFFAVLIGGLIFFVISKLIKNNAISNFVFNFLVSLICITLVFGVLKMKDPVFKNEDAQLFIDYYKGFLMPLLFVPALSWFTLKPLIIKSDD
jgi:hypothetical protein